MRFSTSIGAMNIIMRVYIGPDTTRLSVSDRKQVQSIMRFEAITTDFSSVLSAGRIYCQLLMSVSSKATGVPSWPEWKSVFRGDRSGYLKCIYIVFWFQIHTPFW